MILYMSILLFSIVIGLLSQKIKGYETIYLVIIFSILTLISGFRHYEVGLDTLNYINYFKYINSNSLSMSFEHVRLENGYVLFNYIIGKLTNNPQSIILVSACFINFSFAKTISKYSENVVVSTVIFIIFFFQSSMNGMRQYIAFAIFLLSIKYILKKDYLKYTIMIIIASFFHSSAIILLIFALLTFGNIMNNDKILILFSIISLFLMNYFNTILEIFVRIFPMYNRLLISSYYTSSSQISYLWLAIYFILLVISIFQMKRIQISNDTDFERNKINVNYKTFLVVWQLFFIISYIFANELWIANRIMIYFKPVLIFIIPSIIKDARVNFKKSLLGTVIILFMITVIIVWSYTMFIEDPHGVMPYRFYKIDKGVI